MLSKKKKKKMKWAQEKERQKDRDTPCFEVDIVNEVELACVSPEIFFVSLAHVDPQTCVERQLYHVENSNL